MSKRAREPINSLEEARDCVRVISECDQVRAHLDPAGVAQAVRMRDVLRGMRTRFAVMAGKRASLCAAKNQWPPVVQCEVDYNMPGAPSWSDMHKNNEECLRKTALDFASVHWRNVYETHEQALAEAARLQAQCFEDFVRVVVLPYDVMVDVLAAEPSQFPGYHESNVTEEHLLYIDHSSNATTREEMVDAACQWSVYMNEALDAFLSPSCISQ